MTESQKVTWVPLAAHYVSMRRRLTPLLIVLQLLGPAAQLLSPVLPPILTLSLNANDALCLLLGHRLSSLQFVTLVLFRRVAEDCLYYAAGRLYGAEALATLGLKVSSLPASSTALLALVPSAPLHIAAGTSGVTPLSFVFLSICSTAVRVAALRWASLSSRLSTHLRMLSQAALVVVAASTLAELLARYYNKTHRR